TNSATSSALTAICRSSPPTDAMSSTLLSGFSSTLPPGNRHEKTPEADSPGVVSLVTLALALWTGLLQRYSYDHWIVVTPVFISDRLFFPYSLGDVSNTPAYRLESQYRSLLCPENLRCTARWRALAQRLPRPYP